MKMISLFLFIFLNTILYAESPIENCFYSKGYEFDDTLLIPSQIYKQDINNVKIEELSFNTAFDEIVTLSNQIPILYIYENNKKFYKKILNEEDISKHKFEKKLKKNNILIVKYENTNDAKDKIIFLFSKDNKKFLGSIEIVNNLQIDVVIENSLKLSQDKLCSKEKLWNAYKKFSYMDINQRMKILFSLYSLNQKDIKVKEKIIEIFKKKREILGLAISNIQQ